MTQETLPIQIVADQTFSSALNPLLNKLEMWINFQALKANWYANDTCILSFHFTLVRTLTDDLQFISKEMNAEINKKYWIIDKNIAYYYQENNLTTNAYIAVADLIKTKTNIEAEIKKRLTQVTNSIAKQHALTPLG
tara:strand:+ start:18152 stop:18562 length:411 start_codon:yes stop_codon:yes gene_type:complete